jgi:hypothetical protein
MSRVVLGHTSALPHRCHLCQLGSLLRLGHRQEAEEMVPPWAGEAPVSPLPCGRAMEN